MLGRLAAGFMAILVVAQLACAPALAVEPAGIEFGRYHALVIGNNDYQNLPKLQTAVSDAEAVAAVLEEHYGFEVTLLLNAVRHTITSAFNELRKTLTEKDNLLVYYAGHGFLDYETDTGYWQPVDAELNSDSNWIPNTDLSRYMKAMSAKHVIAIADSCYSGTLLRSSPASLRSGAERDVWLRRLNDKHSRTALTSGLLEPVLDSGGGGHSVFAKALLDALSDNDDVLEGQTLFTRVGRQVAVAAEQQPGYSNIRNAGHEIGGDFLFVPRALHVAAPTGSPSAQASAIEPQDIEHSRWASIKDSDDPAVFAAYLEQYPNGVFAEVARRKIQLARESAEEAKVGTAISQPLREEPSPGAAAAPPASSPAAAAAVIETAIWNPPLPGLVAEREPNDAFGAPTVVAANDQVEGTINPRGDADWYRASVGHPGQLRVVTTAVPAELDIAFRAWDADKNAFTGWFSPVRPGAQTEGVIDLGAKGTYYLEVRDGHNDSAASAPYGLQFEFTPTADRFEPNDSVGKATPLSPSASFRANILPRGDADWYRLEVEHHGELRVVASDVPEALDVNFRAWNADHKAMTGWFSPPRPGADTEAVIDLPEPGAYYLELRDGHDDSRAPEAFEVTMTFTAAPDRKEPNDSFATAAVISLEGSFVANILPRGDVDWYKLPVFDQGELRLRVTDVPQDMDVVLRAWDSNKDVFTGWFGPERPGADTEAVIDIPKAGTYYLEFHDGHDDFRAIEPFTLTSEFTPTGDRFEPNGTVDSAKPIEWGASVTASIFPRGDHDFFAFTVDAPGEKQILVTDVPENLDIVYRVWNAAGRVVGGWTGPARVGADTIGMAALKDAGRYYLEVADGRDDARATKPYTLTIQR
jgi:hypothetical protein